MKKNEDHILRYLQQHICLMGSDVLRDFLHFFVALLPGMKISVTLSGIGCHRIVHSCAPSLELSVTYRSYPEFVAEFHVCVANQHFG